MLKSFDFSGYPSDQTECCLRLILDMTMHMLISHDLVKAPTPSEPASSKLTASDCEGILVCCSSSEFPMTASELTPIRAPAMHLLPVSEASTFDRII